MRTDPTTARPGPPPGTRPWVRRRRWLTVLAAMAAANATWGLLVPLAGVTLTVDAGGETREVGSLAVTLTALLVGLAGWGLLELLERRTSAASARRTWSRVAATVLVLSLAGPATATTAGAAATLVALHLLVGAILIVGLGFLAVERRR